MVCKSEVQVAEEFFSGRCLGAERRTGLGCIGIELVLVLRILLCYILRSVSVASTRGGGDNRNSTVGGGLDPPLWVQEIDIGECVSG